MNWLSLWAIGLLFFLLFPSPWLLLGLAVPFVALPVLAFHWLTSPRR